MPPITDPERLAAYLDALANRKLSGYVRFRLTSQARQYIKDKLNGLPLDAIAERMYQHLTEDGQLDEVVETRPEWCSEWEYHHDMRIVIDGRRVYIETRLQYLLPIKPDESSILVVNLHDA